MRMMQPKANGCIFQRRGEKLEKAKADLPKKRRARINREFDAMTGKVRHSLSFEDEVKPRSRKNPVARAGLKAGRMVDLAARWPDGGFGGSQ